MRTIFVLGQDMVVLWARHGGYNSECNFSGSMVEFACLVVGSIKRGNFNRCILSRVLGVALVHLFVR